MFFLRNWLCAEKEIPKPEIEYLSIADTTLLKQLVDLKLELMHPCLLDAGDLYWFTTVDDWWKVFKYIDDALEYLAVKFPMLAYITAKRDCEDFAVLHKGLVSAFFGLNGYAIVTGTTPFGYHAFGMVKTGRGFRLWEPQWKANEQTLFKIDDDWGYVPYKALI